jgi:hypothetical protein
MVSPQEAEGPPLFKRFHAQLRVLPCSPLHLKEETQRRKRGKGKRKGVGALSEQQKPLKTCSPLRGADHHDFLNLLVVLPTPTLSGPRTGQVEYSEHKPHSAREVAVTIKPALNWKGTDEHPRAPDTLLFSSSSLLFVCVCLWCQGWNPGSHTRQARAPTLSHALPFQRRLTVPVLEPGALRTQTACPGQRTPRPHEPRLAACRWQR